MAVDPSPSTLPVIEASARRSPTGVGLVESLVESRDDRARSRRPESFGSTSDVILTLPGNFSVSAVERRWRLHTPIQQLSC